MTNPCETIKIPVSDLADVKSAAIRDIQSMMRWFDYLYRPTFNESESSKVAVIFMAIEALMREYRTELKQKEKVNE